MSWLQRKVGCRDTHLYFFRKFHHLEAELDPDGMRMPHWILSFTVLEQTASKRRAMGARLMILLINLTSTTHFDLNMFVTSVYSRLSSSSSISSTNTFSVLISVLAPLPTISKFKLALCKKYFTSTVIVDRGVDVALPSLRPRPQARAVRPAQRSGSPKNEEGMSSMKANVSDSTTIASRYTLPHPSEILQLIEQPLNSSFPFNQTLQIKFELLTSYIMLRKTAVGSASQESEWRQMLLAGRVQKAVDSAFAGDCGEMYRVFMRAVIEEL